MERNQRHAHTRRFTSAWLLSYCACHQTCERPLCGTVTSHGYSQRSAQARQPESSYQAWNNASGHSVAHVLAMRVGESQRLATNKHTIGTLFFLNTLCSDFCRDGRGFGIDVRLPFQIGCASTIPHSPGKLYGGPLGSPPAGSPGVERRRLAGAHRRHSMPKDTRLSFPETAVRHPIKGAGEDRAGKR